MKFKPLIDHLILPSFHRSPRLLSLPGFKYLLLLKTVILCKIRLIQASKASSNIVHLFKSSSFSRLRALCFAKLNLGSEVNISFHSILLLSDFTYHKTSFQSELILFVTGFFVWSILFPYMPLHFVVIFIISYKIHFIKL